MIKHSAPNKYSLNNISYGLTKIQWKMIQDEENRW